MNVPRPGTPPERRQSILIPVRHDVSSRRRVTRRRVVYAIATLAFLVLAVELVAILLLRH